MSMSACLFSKINVQQQKKCYHFPKFSFKTKKYCCKCAVYTYKHQIFRSELIGNTPSSMTLGDFGPPTFQLKFSSIQKKVTSKQSFKGSSNRKFSKKPNPVNTSVEICQFVQQEIYRTLKFIIYTSSLRVQKSSAMANMAMFV